ncbi:suppressor of cytokine signaling [Elysia marginata]|uniref:Suppressor of cytokine signaling n=1 Tax=Elysia marginata TaxID=1093978 RepID=A0AAV4ISM0_9GAST|nr:suppressor of cytokine signaling [Elysia marginata]
MKGQGAVALEQKQPTYSSFECLRFEFCLLVVNLTSSIASPLNWPPVLHWNQNPLLERKRKLLLVDETNQSIMCQNSEQTSLVVKGDSVSDLVVDGASAHRERNVLVGPPMEDEEGSLDDSGFSSRGPSVSLGYYKPLAWCVDDFQKLTVATEELDQCGFFWFDLNSDSARRLLRRTPVGTFLVRTSSDPRFLYSLSVKTERGATSVRILYENGLFQFDCDHSIRDQLPRFESVLSLVDFYVLLSQEGGNRMWRWEEVSGDKHMEMTLLQPMRSSVPSLAHQARVTVNQCLENVFFPHLSIDKLNIPQKTKDFLKAYPYRS